MDDAGIDWRTAQSDQHHRDEQQSAVGGQLVGGIQVHDDPAAVFQICHLIIENAETAELKELPQRDPRVFF